MQLHWSQINMFTRCQEQYRRRYIEGEKLPPGVALITGSGMHKGIEATLKYKLEKKCLPPVEAAHEAARDSVAKAFDEGEIFLDETEKAEGLGAMRAKAIDDATRLAGLHHKELAPAVEPVMVERPWVIKIEKPTDVTKEMEIVYPLELAGTIDTDEGHMIDDWKSAGKSPSEGDADASGQITMYSMAKYILDEAIPSARIGYLIKTKVPKALWQTTHRTKAHFEPLLEGITRIARSIAHGDFTFASMQSPRPWSCSPKYCGYYATCKGIIGKGKT